MKNVAYLEVTDFNSDGKPKHYVGDGKPILIMAQGNFCGIFKKATPAYEKLAENMNKVFIATILIDGEQSEKDASKFLKQWDTSYRGVPSYFGFDKNGNFKKVHSGGRDKESLETFANSL